MKKLALLLFFISFFTHAQKAELKKEISKITEGKNATVAVSVLGIDFPFHYSNENAKKNLPMLSVFKFHIALAVLDLVDQNKLSLDQKIFIKKSDLHEKTWSPMREDFPKGNLNLTLDQLLRYMVSKSDNNACDILLELIGGTNTVQKHMDDKKVKNFQIKYNEEQFHTGNYQLLYENYTTTKSLANLLKEFYKEKILSKKATDYLMKLMVETSTGTTKIVEQLPKNTIVAHKTGSSGKLENGLTVAENDAGIITLPNGKHYALVVFVIDSKESEKDGCKIVSNISKVVFDGLNK